MIDKILDIVLGFLLLIAISIPCVAIYDISATTYQYQNFKVIDISHKGNIIINVNGELKMVILKEEFEPYVHKDDCIQVKSTFGGFGVLRDRVISKIYNMELLNEKDSPVCPN